jgi:hypothetical protein
MKKTMLDFDDFPRRQVKFVDSLLNGMYPKGIPERLLFLRDQYLNGEVQIDEIYKEIRKDAE